MEQMDKMTLISRHITNLENQIFSNPTNLVLTFETTQIIY